MVSKQTKALVIADIHLGIEWDPCQSGFSIPSRMKYGLNALWNIEEVFPTG
ncbi:MAG: hypothetical protein R2741_11630 [Methanolobus sp.]